MRGERRHHDQREQLHRRAEPEHDPGGAVASPLEGEQPDHERADREHVPVLEREQQQRRADRPPPRTRAEAAPEQPRDGERRQRSASTAMTTSAPKGPDPIVTASPEQESGEHRVLEHAVDVGPVPGRRGRDAARVAGCR